MLRGKYRRYTKIYEKATENFQEKKYNTTDKQCCQINTVNKLKLDFDKYEHTWDLQREAICCAQFSNIFTG